MDKLNESEEKMVLNQLLKTKEEFYNLWLDTRLLIFHVLKFIKFSINLLIF
jgi:hypothetical protein